MTTFLATTNQAALRNIQSQLQLLTNITALIGEPTDAPAAITAAIIPEGGSIDETTLVAPREIHRVQIRFYLPAFAEPKENTEFQLDALRAQIMADVFGEFTLGGNVAYPITEQFAWSYGYQQVGQTQFRLLDLTIAYRIDDNSVFGA